MRSFCKPPVRAIGPWGRPKKVTLRPMRSFHALALSLLLFACATATIPTATYIERGQAKLLPETVVVDPDGTRKVSALVSINGERRKIAILSSDCNDGVGSISTFDDTRGRKNRQILAFAGGDKPADSLFVAVCDIRRQRMLENQHGSP